MKRKMISLLFAAAFLLMSLPLSVGMLFVRPQEAAANEVLSPPPVLRSADGCWNLDLLSDTGRYLGEHFAFRQQLIGLWSSLNATLESSAEPLVLCGRDGWLFYSDTLPDYSGLSLSDTALRAVASELALMQESLAKEGKSFLFVIAPNKNSLYPDAVPAVFPARHENSSAARLLPLLRDRGVASADLFAAFSAQEETLYYRQDSHWTSRGAALAADAVLGALGRPSARFAGDFVPGEAHRGDLYVMLWPAGTAAEPDSVPAEGFRFEEKTRSRGGEAIRFETACSEGQGSLYCFRDSFGVSLYPYLADAFAEAVFSRSADYDLTAAQEADTVVLELVERNLSRLWRQAPVFPAPERPLPAAKDASTRLPLFAESGLGADGSLTRYRFVLPGEAEEALLVLDGRAYACCINAPEEGGALCASACLKNPAAGDAALIVISNGEALLYRAEPTGGTT